MNKWLNFGGDPDHRLNTGIFRIRYYWEIQEVVNGHKSADHTDSPDGGTGNLAECTVPVIFMVALWNRADHYIFALWLRI